MVSRFLRIKKGGGGWGLRWLFGVGEAGEKTAEDIFDLEPVEGAGCTSFLHELLFLL